MISTASMAVASVFAHRAIWFRLLPMRATCRVRSRSTSRRRGPGAGPRHGLAQQAGRRDAGRRGLRLPVGVLRRRHAGADHGGAVVSHLSISVTSAANAARSAASRIGSREAGGSKGARSVPLASSM